MYMLSFSADCIIHTTSLLSLCFQIGTGYSKKELQDFNQKLAEHWQPFDKKKPPASIELAAGFKEKPDAWIEPSKSAIVQVSCLEVYRYTECSR